MFNKHLFVNIVYYLLCTTAGISSDSGELVNSSMMDVVSGENGEVLFTQFEGKTDRPHCRHMIGDEAGITVKFFQPHIVNRISFLLPTNKEFNRLYSYQVREIFIRIYLNLLAQNFQLKK